MADTFMDWVTGVVPGLLRLPEQGTGGGLLRLPTADTLGIGEGLLRLPENQTGGLLRLPEQGQGGLFQFNTDSLPTGLPGTLRLPTFQSRAEQEKALQPWKGEEQQRQQATAQQRQQAQGMQMAPTAAAARGMTAPAGALGQQITGLAAQKYGPAAAQVIGAVLATEGGLGGAVGDTDISAVGSHGPFQFYGPGGQLDNYARARGLSLEAAGRQARSNPMDAAEWALDTYLGTALQAGVQAGESGEALLRRVLQVQNSGALDSPTHLASYLNALQGAGPDMAAVPQATRGPVPTGIPGQRGAAPQAPIPTGIPGANQQGTTPPGRAAVSGTSPFGEGGTPYRIAFDVGQRYDVPLSGGTTHHRGVDLVPTQGGMGTPVRALRGGTVVGFRQGGDQGNAVVLQDSDGIYNAYFHLQSPNQFAPGTPIQAGQVIGAMGQSGSEGFPHLHLEVRRDINGDRANVIDPLAYFGLR